MTSHPSPFPNGQPYIFLSHKSEEKPFLGSLLQSLLESGVAVFIDNDEHLLGEVLSFDGILLMRNKRYQTMLGGIAWDDSLSAAIEHCSLFMLVASARTATKYLENKTCRRELRHAERNAKVGFLLN